MFLFSKTLQDAHTCENGACDESVFGIASIYLCIVDMNVRRVQYKRERVFLIAYTDIKNKQISKMEYFVFLKFYHQNVTGCVQIICQSVTGKSGSAVNQRMLINP